VHGLGGATVKAIYKKRSFDLMVTTLQAIMLLEFNSEKASLTFEELREALNLPDETVKRLMHSVSCGKYKLVTKASKSKVGGYCDCSV
jgi:cullin 1